MKRIITVSFIALLAISFSGFAQDFSTNPNREVKHFGQIQYAPIDATTITHSVDPVTVTTGTGVACSAGGITSDNQYWRSFVLADFGITDDYAVTMVEFGIEDALAGIGGSQPMTVNLYTTDLVFPTGTLTLIGTLDVMVPDQALTLFQIPVTGTAPAGSELVVEVSIPADTGDGNRFFPGANSLGETADSWISSAGCAITTPVTYTSIGFPTCQLVMSVTGDVGSGGTGVEPEVLYYTFDETGSDSTQNLAVPGSGFAWAQIVGDQTMGPTGQFGDALVGSGSPGNANNVNSGWIPDLGTSDWTMSMWLNNLPAGTALNYLFGENTTNSWRCFYSGAAGEFGVLFRTAQIGGTDVTVPGVGPGPSVLTFVYDQTGPVVNSYINGVLVLTTPQAGPLNMTGGTDFFTVGGYNGSSSGGLPVGSFMDEFRFYNRALDSAEVANTWDIQVPVELTSFTASVDDNDVTLNWETATEINNSGFQVEKKSNGEYKSIGFVPGYGTTTETSAYSFSDVNLSAGTYSYRLKQIDYDGTFEYSDPIEVEILVPDVYSLHQNYPNPFNPSTKITFTIAENANVTLKVFDVLGQEVMTLINQDLTAGIHTYDFDAAGFNSGVYFYRIEANGIDGTNFTNVKKMILLK